MTNSVSNNTIASLAWSVKNHHATIRFMIVGSPNGLTVTALPKAGFYSSGRHNDASTFDYIILNNVGDINGIADPSYIFF